MDNNLVNLSTHFIPMKNASFHHHIRYERTDIVIFVSNKGRKFQVINYLHFCYCFCRNSLCGDIKFFFVHSHLPEQFACFRSFHSSDLTNNRIRNMLDILCSPHIHTYFYAHTLTHGAK